HAQEWNAWGPPNVAAQKVEVFSAACERVDVDMAGKHMSVQALFTLTDDQTRIGEALAGPMGDNTIAGSDSLIVDAIGRYAELGFDEVIVPDFALGDSVEERSDAYERFMTNIVPQIS
ncbi:MAG: alkanesulfonate monooxygenase SsuD, partial [Verrucomicrobiales bacterium]